MKIIEALKQTKDLERKAEDLRKKLSRFASDLDFETPTYENQTAQIKSWLDAHRDILKEILKLRIAIQKTNLATPVEIEIDGKAVTKSIAEWIHRRRDLASKELQAWEDLYNPNREKQDGFLTKSSGENIPVKLRRYYDTKERDRNMEVFSSEPSLIDSKLEVINATTDLVE